jgi:hypothetical protein
MFQPRVFCVKLQLHFGGDIHEISVPAYDGAEPTVSDLMNVVERDFRVPRALQNLVFHGQELHPRPNEPLSRFGVKNLGTIRLVGRMAPPDMIQQINSQYSANSYQQPDYYNQQQYQQTNYNQQQYQQTNYNQQQYQQPNTIATFHTSEQSLPYYYEQFQYEQKPSVGTQYDPPPPPTPNRDQPPPTPNRDQPPPTPNRDQPPPTPTRDQPPPTPNRNQPPPTPNRDQPPPTPNKGQTSERSNGQDQKPPATPVSSNTK